MKIHSHGSMSASALNQQNSRLPMSIVMRSESLRLWQFFRADWQFLLVPAVMPCFYTGRQVRKPSFPGSQVRRKMMNSLEESVATPAVSLQEAREIAKEAFIYGFPMVANYQTMHKQALDTAGHDFRAPFNQLASLANVATPEDKFVVTPNSDTPYSFLWMDLRAEPIVITMPKVEANRYYSAQLIDLYTFNVAYLGSRVYGNDGGAFLLAGPGWSGQTPSGVRDVVRFETEFAYALFRTQLFNPGDLDNVKGIQKGYKAQPLSSFLGGPAPQPASAVAWMPPSDAMLASPALFSYLNLMLQFCPTNPTETDLMARFAKLNIGAGKHFDFGTLSPELQQEVIAGLGDVKQAVEAEMANVNSGKVGSSDVFGTRAFLKNNYLYRFMAAKLGLYGNTAAEAIYLPYFVDAKHQKLDASGTKYKLSFAKGQLPPAKSFWSLTMYDGKTQFLVANPLERYLLNSTILRSFTTGADGSLARSANKKCAARKASSRNISSRSLGRRNWPPFARPRSMPTSRAEPARCLLERSSKRRMC